MKYLFALLALGASISAQPKSTFQTSTINVGCNPIAVVTADFNGDHVPDLAYVCSTNSTNPIMVLSGKGDGTFSAPVAVPGPHLGNVTGNKLVTGDFDRDGKSDLAYVAANGNLIVLLSAGDGSFRSLTTTPANPKLALGAAVDLDRNGIPDLIFLSGLNDSLVTYVFGKGDGTFGAPTVVPWPAEVLVPLNTTPSPHAVTVLTADFNGDGKPDISVGVARAIKPGSNTGTPISEVRLYTLSSRPADFAAPVVESFFADSRMVVADFDGDGKLDVACGGSESIWNSVNLYFLLGFSPLNSNVEENGPMQAGDFNGEGKARVVIGSSLLNALIIYTFEGAKNGKNSGFISLSQTPNDIVVVDLNGDGKPDIVTSNSSSSTIAINTSSIAPRISGALNGASFAVGQPMAPGSLASLFGIGLAPAPELASAVPLPLNLGGLSLTVGGVPAPLLYVSATQVNFQVPWTVSAGSADIVTTVNGSPLTKLTITIGAVEPGIFSVPAGTGTAIAINPDGSLAALEGSIPGIATHPAKPGDTILILGTGLGAVTPNIATGAAASDGLRTTAVTPKVLIGGTSASVAFSGLSPQFVGVNQLNVVVPSIPAGIVSLQIDAGGVRSTDKVTIAIANP